MSGEAPLTEQISSWITKNKTTAIILGVGSALAIYVAYSQLSSSESSTPSQPNNRPVSTTSSTSKLTPEERMKKKLEKMQNRRHVNKKVYDDPYEEFIDLFLDFDARISPGVFKEFLVLLVRCFAGFGATFNFNESIRLLTPFPGARGQYQLIGFPGRHAKDQVLMILGERFEWEPYGAYNFEEIKQVTNMAFVECGEIEVARDDFRERTCCIFSTSGGTAQYAAGIAFDTLVGVDNPHLLLYAQSTWGLNADGDTRSPPITATPILDRENATQIICAIWRQNQFVYALESTFDRPGSKQIVFKLHKIQVMLSLQNANELDVTIEQVEEYWAPTESYYNQFTNFDGMHYDPENHTIVGRLNDKSGNIVRFYDGKSRRKISADFAFSSFGYLSSSDSYFGATSNGTVYEVLIKFTDEDDAVEFREVGLPPYPAWGVKSVIFNPDSKILHVVNQFMASSKFGFCMSNHPIESFLADSK